MHASVKYVSRHVMHFLCVNVALSVLLARLYCLPTVTKLSGHSVWLHVEGYLPIGYGFTPFPLTRKQLSFAAFFPVFLDDGNIFNFIVIYLSFFICLIGRVHRRHECCS